MFDEQGNLIAPKFKMGDLVYYGSAVYDNETIVCPVCEGSGKWKVQLNENDNIEVDCQSCSRGWERGNGYIQGPSHFTPKVKIMTIGKISYDNGYRYMCHETGIGSGTMWDEERLSSTYQEAEERAKQDVSDRLDNQIKNNLHKKTVQQVELLLSTVGYVELEKKKKKEEAIIWLKHMGVMK